MDELINYLIHKYQYVMKLESGRNLLKEGFAEFNPKNCGKTRNFMGLSPFNCRLRISDCGIWKVLELVGIEKDYILGLSDED
jgi:hypothetical protein